MKFILEFGHMYKNKAYILKCICYQNRYMHHHTLYKQVDPMLANAAPEPSNPWISDDITMWMINTPMLVYVYRYFLQISTHLLRIYFQSSKKIKILVIIM